MNVILKTLLVGSCVSAGLTSAANAQDIPYMPWNDVPQASAVVLIYTGRSAARDMGYADVEWQLPYFVRIDPASRRPNRR